jgi:hypothetical protein
MKFLLNWGNCSVTGKRLYASTSPPASSLIEGQENADSFDQPGAGNFPVSDSRLSRTSLFIC